MLVVRREAIHFLLLFLLQSPKFSRHFKIQCYHCLNFEELNQKHTHLQSCHPDRGSKDFEKIKSYFIFVGTLGRPHHLEVVIIIMTKLLVILNFRCKFYVYFYFAAKMQFGKGTK